MTMNNKIQKYITHTFFAAMTVLILINADKAMEYAKSGLNLCYDIIIPSLFPFFVCSGLLVYSGFTQVLSKVFTPVMLPLFRINGSGAAAFILGIVSGYPLGASTACSLYENRYLSKTETERLLAFCSNSGPLFILGAVGISLYNSPLIGWCLYISHILAAVSVGIIFRFYSSGEFIAPPYELSQPELPLSEVFSSALRNSVNSIINVCGTVIFFCVAVNIIMGLIPSREWYVILLSALIEFTSGTVNISGLALPLVHKLILSAFVVGFAGLSVHCQVISIISKYHLSIKPYLLGKICHAFLSALYMLVILKFVPVSVAVFNFTSFANISGSFAVSALYVLSSVICIIFICIFYWVYAKVTSYEK